MSIASHLVSSVRPALTAVHADEWRVEKTGAVFEAVAAVESPIVIDSEIGSDAREKTTLQITRPIPVFSRAEIISGRGSRWRIVGEIDDNPVLPYVKVEVAKVEEGKDL
ncbi:MAG: hypothetical protein QM813_26345 [Verrucomicrobiota bacterium]